MFIESALAAQLAEIATWCGLYSKYRKSKAENTLLWGRGRQQPRRIPIVDSKLRELAGHPNRFQKLISRLTVTFLRRLVNTRAFEYAVLGLINRDSRFYQKGVKAKRLFA